MASNAPTAIDTADIQFKLNSKYQLVTQEVKENKGNLVAAASAYGLIIVGTSEANLKVLQQARVVSDKDKDVIPSRSIPLPAPPHAIALSCDHSMLAVNFKQNEMAFVNVYSVPSFVSNNIKILHQSIRLCTDDGVTATQLLWNPVLSTTLAVCLSNKSLLVFTFKDQGYDFYSIDKAEQVGCVSWSPKGKQIVAGFPNGKIAQYKPDLKLARTIPCTVSLYNTAWEVIAIQWLSTYQFAAVMLTKEEDACPALYIIYAPKNGSPIYTNYADICYSQSGPRTAQMTLSHILAWNLLLVLSANGTEVGVLGTTDTGDNPLWKQYIMLDEARAELPLTANQDEMFPLGMDVDTGTTHRITINETPLPAMPMLHILSTHGLFISFNILNTTPNCPSICSPPQLMSDTSGLSNFVLKAQSSGSATTSSADLSFGFPAAVTSTPHPNQKVTPFTNANEQPKSAVNLFKNAAAAEPTKTFSNLFGGQTTIQPVSSAQSAFSFVQKSTESTTATTFAKPSQTGLFGPSPSSTAPATAASASPVQSKQSAPQPPTSDQTSKSESSQPFITVAPTFSQSSQSKANATQKTTRPKSSDEQCAGDDDIIKKMILEEVQSYETLAKTLLMRCKSVDVRIGTKDESVGMLKQLIELQDISNQATESTEALAMEIQSLKVSLNETYLMVAELKSKHSLLNDANYTQLSDVNAMSQTSRRQLLKLEKLLALNENQYRIISQQINAHWSSHEENKKQNARAKMHIPALENIYQTLTKQRDIVNRQKIKINYIKSRLGYKDNSHAPKITREFNITSLTDSMVSMSLCDHVKLDTERLSHDKLNSLRDLLKNRKILQITPKRPERIGLSSEIVMEKRKAQEKKKILPAPKSASNKIQATTQVQISKQATSQPPRTQGIMNPQATVKDVSKLSVSETGIQLSKSTSKAELRDILSNKTNIGVPANVNSESVQSSVSISSSNSIEPSGFGISKNVDKTAKGYPPVENAQTAFGSKMSIAFGNSSSGEKAASTFGGSLFGNLVNTTITSVPSTTQPSGLFASNALTITPIPFGSQSSNTSSVIKSDFAKQDTPSPSVDSNQQKPAVNTIDKENVNKAMQPSMSFPEKIDSAPKAMANQSNLSNFGIKSSVTPQSPTLFAGTGTKTTVGAFSLATSSHSDHSTKAAPSSAVTTTATKAVTTTNATPNVVVSTTTQSGFTFSLDKMGITPQAPTADVPQKSVFKLDPKIEPAATSVKVSTAKDTDKLVENLVICSPSTEKAATSTPSGGNIFSMSSFTTPTKSDSSSSIFGGNATTQSTSSPFSSFGSLAVTTTADNNKPSIFASSFSSPNVTSPSSQSSPFGKPTSVFGTPVTQSTFGAPVNAFGTSTSTTTPFGSSSSTTNAFGTATTSAFGTATTSAFGTPSTSAFGTPTTSAFGTATTSAFGTPTTSAFGTPTTSAFGTATSAFGTPTTSAFGTATTNAFATATTNAFGATTPNAFGTATTNAFGAATTNAFGSTTTNAFGSSSSSSNIFGSNTGHAFASNAGNAFSPTKSIFGGTSTDQTPATAFGSSNLFGSPNAAAATSPFASSQNSGSIFGGSSFGGAAQGTSAGSIFGGGSTSSTGFGQSTFGNSAFSQQNSSPFGSPGQDAFSAQGASVGFGTSPTFGGQATFGAATFGSPKGFGTFASVPNAFAASPPQQNSLFETLGSSDTGLSFGNIAQSSNTTAPKPAFGGGSFSTWR